MTEWIDAAEYRRRRAASARMMLAAAPAGAAKVQPLAQVEGDIPDEHVVTVRERRVTVDYPTIIQDNMATDTLRLDLDGEWDGMQVLVYVGYTGDLDEFQWNSEPITLPVYTNAGSLDVTVVGMSSDGKIRLVTAEAKAVMTVIKAGEHEGSVPEADRPDLLAQILAAKEGAEDATAAANTAASAANTAAENADAKATAANSAASAANEAATAANGAATAANAAASDASDAAEEARAAAGMVSQDKTIFLGYDTVGDVSYLTLYDQGDD